MYRLFFAKHLVELGRLNEAQQILEYCLRVFKEVGDLTAQSMVLFYLANVWEKRDDVSHAIELTQQALAIFERLANPEDTAETHGKLSKYLHKNGQIKEGILHRFAEMIYDIVTDNQQMLELCLHDLTEDMQQAAQTNTLYPLPRFNDLLEHSKFSALRLFLEEREVNLDELQKKIDELIKQMQNQVFENK